MQGSGAGSGSNGMGGAFPEAMLLHIALWCYVSILPLARPALAVVALFTFMNNWNDFLGPLIYLNREHYTLAIGLYGFLSRVKTEWGPLMAAATLMVSPIIVLFFFTQRTFIQGITLTGIKG